MKFIITVDVEADNQWKADKRKNVTLENIKSIPRFQALCEKYDFKPTYLVAYEIANDAFSVNVLKDCLRGDNAEIGAHLHPWTNPPFQEGLGEMVENAYPSELSDSELQEKIICLTEKIKENFGFSPLSFRAGRWGFDGRMVDYLSESGYLADCSITPKIDWRRVAGKSNGAGGPDFRQAPVCPYVLSSDDVRIAGKSRLLEVPMTIVHTGIFCSENSVLNKYSLTLSDSFIKKVLDKLFFRLNWCRILPGKSFTDLKKVHQSAVKNGLPVLEFMIHSSELLPGGSPYAKTPLAVENIYLNLENFFQYLNHQGVIGTTLADYARNYK